MHRSAPSALRGSAEYGADSLTSGIPALDVQHLEAGWYIISRRSDGSEYLYNKVAGKLGRLAGGGAHTSRDLVLELVRREDVPQMELFTPERFERLRKVPRLVLYPTAACNLRCVYCHCNSGGPGQHMPDSLLSEVVAKYLRFIASRDPTSQIAEITFMGGGEPLLQFGSIRKVVEMVGRAGYCGSYALVTNGTIGTPAMWKWLVAHRFRITISADGPPPVQDSQRPFFRRGRATSAVLERRLGMLALFGASVNIRSTVTQSSPDAVDAICGYFDGFPAVVTHQLEPRSLAGRGRRPSDSDPSFYARFFTSYAPHLYARPERFKSAWFKPFHKTEGFCGAVYFNPVVTHDGYVAVCTEVDSSMRETQFGQEYVVTHVSEDEPFHSAGAAAFSRNHATDVMRPCRDCIIQYKCGGGCYIKRDRDMPGDWDAFRTAYCENVIQLNMGYLLQCLNGEDGGRTHRDGN